MKKLVLIIVTLIIIGCKHQHVFDTYYGFIDIDTMNIALYDIKDSLPCYLVHESLVDSVEKVPGIWGYIQGPIKYFYCPNKDTYYYSFPDMEGNRIICAYNPFNKKLSNPDEQ